MIWTGWNKGKKHSTGARYGFKITAVERDLHFKPEWRCIAVELPTPSGQIVVEVEINKQAGWGDCRELISKDIGRGLLDQGYAPWAKGIPSKFAVEPLGERAFRIARCAPDVSPERAAWVLH